MIIGIDDLLALAGHHRIDGRADLFGDPLGCHPGVAGGGRRGLIEYGQGSLGGHGRCDVFHGRHHRK
jgi:hypothetical protein